MLNRLLLHSLSLFSFFLVQGSHKHRAVAQFIQTYERTFIPDPNNDQNGAFSAFRKWQPTPSDIPQTVIDVAPVIVYLEYNCAYMRDICQNAINWYNTPTGSAHNPSSLFAYDLHNQPAGSSRKDQRRNRSCPPNWMTSRAAAGRPCPETTQHLPMRNDGEWPYTDLEPGTRNWEIRSIRDGQGNVISRSWIKYTCDEFPPATWVEGGSGFVGANASSAETRCAAFRCNGNGRRIKAEQNWQSRSHSVLRSTLIDQVSDYFEVHPDIYPTFNKHADVVTFYFRMRTAADGIAASVYTYGDLLFTSPPPLNVKHINQAKKRDSSPTANMTLDEIRNWANTVSLDDLRAAGLLRTVAQIPANSTDEDDNIADTSSQAAAMAGMVMSANLTYWEDDNLLYSDDDDDDNDVPQDPLWKRQDVEADSVADSADPDVSNGPVAPLAKAASSAEIDNARRIVEEALDKCVKLNMARYENPLRNHYGMRPGTVLAARNTADGDVEPVPPLLEITDEIADAAALVAEADALALGGNITAAASSTRSKRQAASFWMGQIARKGIVPWGNDPSYKVFRNVRDYGAVGNGVTDDTKAIKAAMTDGKRCARGCNGATTTNAIVYFPAGTYKISSSIPMPFGTQVIGDANNLPTLVAAKTFLGLGVLSTDEYTGGGTGVDGEAQEYYINTANFYRQIRNIKIDITQTRPTQGVSALHYQVAQATSLQNVELIATSGTTQRGIFAENGSGGMISDVVFRGGMYGLYGGNQQFTSQRLTFIGCDTGVQVIWDWGWVWKSITMSDVGVGFKLLQDDTADTSQDAGATGNIGSASFYDSTFTNVGTAILIAPPSPKPGTGSTGLIIENVDFQGVSTAVADSTGASLLTSAGKVSHWALGPVYGTDGANSTSFSNGGPVGRFVQRNKLLDSTGAYFERAKPQYEGHDVGDFLHVRDFGARGDGVTDDTAAFQAALYGSQGRILFVDAGSYILTSTVFVPLGSKIVGETWSQLVASGSYFKDASNPKVMLQVGTKGSVGNIEMQDLLFTTKGATAGVILVEWNVRAENAGTAALWDCHARIGGAIGTDLTPAECPAVTFGVNAQCAAASLMMHLTPGSSGYFENMWLWGSDHMIDDPNLADANNTMVQNSVYVARGFLIESTDPTWLYGTASEHAVFYQYNFHKARNVFAGMIQTESPYFQPTPRPPAPFETAVGVFSGDPDYSCLQSNQLNGCDSSWGVIIRGSADIFVAGAGLYSWFSTYTQDCIDEHSCQKALMLLEDNVANVRIQHLITIGAEYMVVQDGVGIKALDYLNVQTHPKWSQISVLDATGSESEFGGMIWIDPKIWDMEVPSFSCRPPCLVKIPPWQHATRIVDYPRIPVSQGTWTSTLTRPPLTMTNVIFEPVTLRQDSGGAGVKKRQGFEEFWPVPATTPYWPKVTYTAPDGVVQTTAPSVPFPPPPAAIGPDVPAPFAGRWPKRAIVPFPLTDPNLADIPTVGMCEFIDFFSCSGDPWTQNPFPNIGDGGDGGDEDNGEDGTDDSHDCYEPKKTTSTTTTTTMTTSITTGITTTVTTAVSTTQPDEPEASPSETGHPDQNVKQCYGSGHKTTHIKLDNAIISFCNNLGDPGEIKHAGFSRYENNEYDQDWFEHLWVYMKFEVRPGCEWTYNFDECQRYMHVPVDACNCGGVNGKQGGSVSNNCLYWRVDPNQGR